MKRKILWFLFGFFCIGIALYAFSYLFMDRSDGLLGGKPAEVLQNVLWQVSFYSHVGFGGLALLIGWIQFSRKLRKRNLEWHRWIGKVYVISCLLSGTASIYVAFYATGGFIPMFGFLGLGIIWLYSTLMAWSSIRKLNFAEHERMMIYSYAMCMAAVTLRIYLPFLTMGFGDFFTAYKIVAWLCWVPNLIIAYFIVRSKSQNHTLGVV